MFLIKTEFKKAEILPERPTVLSSVHFSALIWPRPLLCVSPDKIQTISNQMRRLFKKTTGKHVSERHRVQKDKHHI